ncbi:MAG: 50S ribosomal protein L6 [Gammaproteobacteria bacterium]|nr:50S ribosomal protein L6 [Gammaproteobacteria bacterium]MDE1886809.1 50S ribosomal protein L6 [Gammaproteobacteria bacterium]MDE2023760.1 50S ribosomal protein L6 [Gammaproteobacteria bacterium]MDE2140460.1 50S ribosomal protein L6 [Gammaproteobacteria bacterium]MDE2272938.1 50S ribosomal protein L6 [Gammaproteobacteria bacterium]
MSRIAKQPVVLPKGVDATVSGSSVTVKGQKSSLTLVLHPHVTVVNEKGVLHVAVKPEHSDADASAGTTRALLNNAVKGVTQGFQKKLELVGVGYRAQMQGKTLNLAIGFSHPVNYKVPEGISIETPSQTEIVIKGVDRQKVGQVAAEIRGFRPPEPYKGKGVRYTNERVVLKEAKKK